MTTVKMNIVVRSDEPEEEVFHCGLRMTFLATVEMNVGRNCTNTFRRYNHYECKRCGEVRIRRDEWGQKTRNGSGGND